MSTVPVYVIAADADPVLLFENWPADQLEGAMRLLRMWGASDADGQDLDTDAASGQFRIGETRAVFEIILERTAD